MFLSFSIIFYILLQGLYEKMVTLRPPLELNCKKLSSQNFFFFYVKIMELGRFENSKNRNPWGLFFFYSKTGFFLSQQKVQFRIGLHSVCYTFFCNCPGTWRKMEFKVKNNQSITFFFGLCLEMFLSVSIFFHKASTKKW